MYGPSKCGVPYGNMTQFARDVPSANRYRHIVSPHLKGTHTHYNTGSSTPTSHSQSAPCVSSRSCWLIPRYVVRCTARILRVGVRAVQVWGTVRQYDTVCSRRAQREQIQAQRVTAPKGAHTRPTRPPTVRHPPPIRSVSRVLAFGAVGSSPATLCAGQPGYFGQV